MLNSEKLKGKYFIQLLTQIPAIGNTVAGISGENTIGKHLQRNLKN